jgi:hypothetical protein
MRKNYSKLLFVIFFQMEFECKNTEVSQKKAKQPVKQPLGSYDWVFFILWNKTK